MASMGALESYVLEEINSDIESVAKQVVQLYEKHLYTPQYINKIKDLDCQH